MWTSFIASCDIKFIFYVFFNNIHWGLPSWPKEAEQRPSDTGINGGRNFLASFDIPDKLDIADNYISLIWTNGVFRTNTGTPDKDFFPAMLCCTNNLDKEALIHRLHRNCDFAEDFGLWHYDIHFGSIWFLGRPKGMQRRQWFCSHGNTGLYSRIIANDVCWESVSLSASTLLYDSHSVFPPENKIKKRPTDRLRRILIYINRCIWNEITICNETQSFVLIKLCMELFIRTIGVRGFRMKWGKR